MIGLKFFKKLKKIELEPWLIIILVFAIALRLYFFVGFNWSDNPAYCNAAYNVSNGDFYLGNYIVYLRTGMVFPTAFFFKIFGVNELSAVLYPLLTSLGSIVLIYYFGKYFFSKKVGLLAALFLSVFPVNVIYSTWTMPDVPVAFYCALSVLIFLKANDLEKTDYKFLSKRQFLFFLSGLLIGVSYLHRVSGAIIILFIIMYMLYIVYKKKKIDFDYSFLFLGFFLVLLLEGFFFYSTHGDFFTRYNLVTNYYLNPENSIVSLAIYPFTMFNISIDSVMYEMYFLSYYGLFYYFIFVGFIYAVLKKSKKALILVSWFLILFVYLEFGTMSLTEYLPIHKLPRHLSVLTIPSLLCLSYFLIDFIKNKKHFKIRKIVFVFVVLLLVFSSIYYISKGDEYLDASTWDMKEIYNYVKEHPDKKIYCDRFTGWHLKFHFKYENNENIIDYATLDDINKINDSFLISWGSLAYIINFDPTFSDNITLYHQNPPEGWFLAKTITGPEINRFADYNPKIYYIE